MVLRIPLTLVLACCAALAAQTKFTLEQILSAPFPTDLTASPKGGAVAWVLDQNGARNIWVAEAPDYKGRRLTNYHDDDGQAVRPGNAEAETRNREEYYTDLRTAVSTEESTTVQRITAEEKAAKLGVKLIFPIFFCILPSLFVVTVGPVAMKIIRELVPMMQNI